MQKVFHYIRLRIKIEYRVMEKATNERKTTSNTAMVPMWLVVGKRGDELGQYSLACRLCSHARLHFRHNTMNGQEPRSWCTIKARSPIE